MKKDMDKLIENCRICEKRVKLPNLLEHTNYCEKNFQFKEKFDEIRKTIIEKNKIIQSLIFQRNLKNKFKYDSPLIAKSTKNFDHKTSCFKQNIINNSAKRKSTEYQNLTNPQIDNSSLNPFTNIQQNKYSDQIEKDNLSFNHQNELLKHIKFSDMEIRISSNSDFPSISKQKENDKFKSFNKFNENLSFKDSPKLSFNCINNINNIRTSFNDNISNNSGIKTLDDHNKNTNENQSKLFASRQKFFSLDEDLSQQNNQDDKIFQLEENSIDSFHLNPTENKSPEHSKSHFSKNLFKDSLENNSNSFCSKSIQQNSITDKEQSVFTFQNNNQSKVKKKKNVVRARNMKSKYSNIAPKITISQEKQTDWFLDLMKANMKELIEEIQLRKYNHRIDAHMIDNLIKSIERVIIIFQNDNGQSDEFVSHLDVSIVFIGLIF